MKKYILFPAALFCGIVFFQSCKKEHETKYITLNETLKAGAVYSLDVSAYGDADDIASITKQAAHYAISQIDKDGVSAENIYHFSVDTKSQANETVVITLSEDHGGRSGGRCNHDEAVITVNFTVK